MIERFLLITLAVIFAGSIGAFFLFVAILPVVGVAAVLTGLVAMFGLGYFTGHTPGGFKQLFGKPEACRTDQDKAVAIADRGVDAVGLAG